MKRGYHNEALGVLTAISASVEQYAGARGDYGSSTTLSDFYDINNHSQALQQVYTFDFVAKSASSYAINAEPKNGGPLADEGDIILYWDGRKGWDSDDDGTYEVIDF